VCRLSAGIPPPCSVAGMERLARFEDHRYVGDKRNQVVHDVDSCTDASVLQELVEAETFLCFGPDTLAEARNRGYKLCRRCDGVREVAAAESNGE
jgi:hypothetical protein